MDSLFEVGDEVVYKNDYKTKYVITKVDVIGMSTFAYCKAKKNGYKSIIPIRSLLKFTKEVETEYLNCEIEKKQEELKILKKRLKKIGN